MWDRESVSLLFFSLFIHSFLSFKANLVSHFPEELCKLESSNMVYICRMSDCIVGLRLRVMALILLLLSVFLSFHNLHVTINSFLSQFSQEFVKLEFET